MFKELQPLLANRSLTITVAALHDEIIRINVIPHPRPEDTKVNEQVKYSHKDEVAPIPDAAVKALTTPISLTGTAEEIDAQLSGVLLQFVESHTQLQATFDRASTEMSEAVKAIDERNKNKPKTKAAVAKAEQKEDAKAKQDDGKSKHEETLPLWWTDGSVQPPGVSAATQAPPVTATQDEGSHSKAQSSNLQEVSQPCR